MKLKDIAKHAALYLGLEKAVGYIENGAYEEDGDALSTVDLLTRCSNLVLNELAGVFIPMVKTEALEVDGDRAYYSAFSDAPRRIRSVKNANGDEVRFEVFATYMTVDASAAQVEYEYFPPNYDLGDTVGYENEISARAIAYGVAAEYSIIQKAFDESLLWRDRFEKALKKAVPQKNGVIKGRAFV